MKSILIVFVLSITSATMLSKELHVAMHGDDRNKGTVEFPLLTIQAAANLALPGDTVTVHRGVYREWIKPARGGDSESNRILYRTAEGEKVEIKGSEIIGNWERLTGSVWMVSISNDFFGDFNPYEELVKGDWFRDNGRDHHRGEVYLNGKSLWESATFYDVLNPKIREDRFDPAGSAYTWYCESDGDKTYIYANFHEADPNKELVEINVRQSCFYPDTTGINYITVRGFRMSQAATQWAPPTAEQIGLIGTHWSKGWIIEDNIISDSKCSGITLGKYGDEWDNKSANQAEGYVETIERALANGWNSGNIGHHIIRNNTIFHCEQTGICGSMGAVFSTIENNNIYNIWVKRQFNGAEIGGIKIHGAIDMIIRNNRLANCCRGIWLDWMAQGTIVSANLLYGNTHTDIFVEVNHGPFIIENNLLLSKGSILDWSQGGAYLHNLVAGRVILKPQTRLTPYHPPHTTELAGLTSPLGGDNRYYNNIFVGAKDGETRTGLKAYDDTEHRMYVKGNVYLGGANPYINETNPLIIEANPSIRIEEVEDEVYLHMDLDKHIFSMKNQTVTTGLLGKARIPDQEYTNPDGTAYTLSQDYPGLTRNRKNPAPGPFEKPGSGELRLKVW